MATPDRVGPTGLPIEECIEGLRAALSRGRAAVLRAEPGAGKSTVVPLRLLSEPWLNGQRIVMLEPRRLATRATATRMSSMLGEPVGTTVGYRTRDESKVGPSTRIEVVTEGILIRRLQRDAALAGTGMVIFDEVHERGLQTDLSLALTLDSQHGLRPDLRVLTMSATVDELTLARLLGERLPVPIISSTGRSHPVDIRWRPLAARQRLDEAVADAVRAALRSDPGDVLVFLSGAAEINRVARLLANGHLAAQGVDVRPLFGGLTSAEQDAALAPSPHGRRRVVLATDIAETSLTVSGVRVVIDSGEVRRPEFDTRSGLTRLRTTSNSQASATQRAGRAGRTEPGVTYRLWSQHDHERRREFAEPEIRSADLSALVLELAIWGADASELRFLDPPTPVAIEAAQQVLHRLGALDSKGRPTDTGRAMSELPLHPRLARMVIDADPPGDGAVATVIAALLEERDILGGRPGSKATDLDERVQMVLDSHRTAGSGAGRTDPVAAARRRSRDIERRSGPGSSRGRSVELWPGQTGRVLALAYPDRIAQGIGGGRFRLRSGQRVTMAASDALASSPFIVVADVGPARRPETPTSTGGGLADESVRIAAALDASDLDVVAGDSIESTSRLIWNPNRNELERRDERRLGAIVLASSTSRVEAGPATTAALVERVRERGLETLGWGPGARALQERGLFARRTLGDSWPDISDQALTATIDEWLTPLLATGVGRADIERVDVLAALRSILGHHLFRQLDQAVPKEFVIPTGRALRIDYDTEPPSISVRIQDMFGAAPHPTVAEGRVRLAVHLLSPAGRVVQVTSDLPGFWAGSWVEVRKELAGRYPRHDWPIDPSAATAGRRPSRRR